MGPEAKRQCGYCSAYFDSSDLLENHLHEYRVRATELEACRAHAQSDTPEDERASFYVSKDTACPFTGCAKGPGSNGRTIRDHFFIHVDCLEPCLHCAAHISRNASQFFKHSVKCYGKNRRQRDYIAQVKEALKAEAEEKLLGMLQPGGMRMVARNSVIHESCRARPHHAADGDSESGFQPRPTKRHRLNRVANARINAQVNRGSYKSNWI